MKAPANVRTQPLTAADVTARLRERFSGQEWAFFAELRGGTAWTRESRADGLAMNLWPSRGMEVHGFEIKVSRSDWTRELKNPAKAEQLQQFCDRWWVVLGDEKIIQSGELPPTWGLMVPRGLALRVVKEAPKLEAKPLDRPFIAAILKRASSAGAVEPLVQAAVDQARKRWEADRQQLLDLERASDRRQITDLEEQIAAFEKASGLEISRWSARNIGEAVRFVMETRGKGNAIADQLRVLAQKSRQIAENAEAALASWPAEKASGE